MSKTKFSSRMKIAFLNVMQAFGSAASLWASHAKLRVQEINLESKRHEILTESSLQAFELWHNGVELPPVLADMFAEISAIDEKLSVLRAQKYAKVKPEHDEAAEDGEQRHPDEIDAEALVCTPAPATDAPKKPAAKKPGEPKPKE
ncbi:MAG TPA: hypothetical protein PKU80_01755 [Candidatus Limiplasma sp.]|nr:hypothetical protein [Candidatus Limiplasma sp.]HRX08717.1 hypothetical protein [Candidatus Limiplasma sp.]